LSHVTSSTGRFAPNRGGFNHKPIVFVGVFPGAVLFEESGGVACFGGTLAATANPEPPPPKHGDQAARKIRRAPMAMDRLGGLDC
jgi:hypothetical protein